MKGRKICHSDSQTGSNDWNSGARRFLPIFQMGAASQGFQTCSVALPGHKHKLAALLDGLAILNASKARI